MLSLAYARWWKRHVEIWGRYVRCWQGKGRLDCKVVAKVAPFQLEAFFRAAASLRQQIRVAVGPCLTALGCALRKERQSVSNSLCSRVWSLISGRGSRSRRRVLSFRRLDTARPLDTARLVFLSL